MSLFVFYLKDREKKVFVVGERVIYYGALRVSVENTQNKIVGSFECANVLGWHEVQSQAELTAAIQALSSPQQPRRRFWGIGSK